MVVNSFLQAIADGNLTEFETSLQAVEAGGLWPVAFLAVRSKQRPISSISQCFHTLWTTRGHRIRSQVSDDNVILDALWVLLPSYQGSGVTLYRGESLERWISGQIGSAWTPQMDIARMFARGLNAVVPDGGVLLATNAPEQAVIAGPNGHSIWLGEHEYVVDRRQINIILEVERFPPP